MNTAMLDALRKQKRSTDADTRRFQRHATEGVSCDLGEVADLSEGGMRVVTQGRPPVRTGQIHSLRISAGDDEINVAGRFVRMRRVSLKRFETGVEFINLPEAKADQIRRLAINGGRPEEQDSGVAGRIHATVELPDYYAALEVSPDASDQEIQAAHRRLVRMYHPDVSDIENCEWKFREIQEAWEILKDAQRRRAYDRRLAG